MQSTGGLIACHSCDLLVNVAGLKDGEKATCPRCGQYLTRLRLDALDRVMSYSIAGLVFLAVSLAFPFLSFAASGLESVMTLPQTPIMLYEEGLPEMAFLVAAFIIVIPVIVLMLLLLVALPVHYGWQAPWLLPATRWLFNLQNWAMVEVFIIGVIVSLVKIAKMATVSLGISFWAYAAFALCFTLALASLDRYQSWQKIEGLMGGG